MPLLMPHSPCWLSLLQQNPGHSFQLGSPGTPRSLSTEVPFHRDGPQPGGYQPVLHRLSQMQGLTLVLMELHSGFFPPFLPASPGLPAEWALPSTMSASPCSLVSLAKFSRVCFISSSRSPEKIIKNIGSNIDLGGLHLRQSAGLERIYLL